MKSDDVEKVACENIQDAEKVEESTEVVELPMKIDMNVNTKNNNEFKDAVIAKENANVNIMEDANEQLNYMNNVEVTTKYVDVEKVSNRNKKYVEKVDDNTELAGETVKENPDVELNVDADVDVEKVAEVSAEDVDDEKVADRYKKCVEKG